VDKSEAIGRIGPDAAARTRYAVLTVLFAG